MSSATPLPNPTPWDDKVAQPRTDYLSRELGTAPKHSFLRADDPVLTALVRRLVAEELDRRAPKTGPLTCRECKEAAAAVFGVTVEQINGRMKTRLVSQARQAAIWAAFHLTGQHLSEVARNFDRDHTCIRYAVENCAALCGTNGDFAEKVDAMRRALRRPN